MSAHLSQTSLSNEVDVTSSQHSTTSASHIGTEERNSPHVMIVGAGVGGLFLAILLGKAGIPYEIYERSSEVRALALAMNIKFFRGLVIPQALGLVEYLYALLQSQIPAEKIHFNKKVETISQDKDKVVLRCADGTTHQGDILVGADGAYSTVRQDLYRVLNEKHLLPPSDLKSLAKGYTCLVGTTDPVDPEKYPFVKKDHTNQLQVIVEGSPYTFTVFNIPGNRICYVAVYQFKTVGETEAERFHNAEWSSDRTKEIIDVVKDFKAPCGGTLGDLIDLTPPGKVSRVFLEDKLFETWTHGRIALIGDAAHKLLPSAGQGAVCAMQDAVVLANCIYEMGPTRPSASAIKAALQEYKDERYSYVKNQYENSKTNAIFLHGQTPMERVIRYVVFNWLPDSFKNRQVFKDLMYRPQASFLELPPQRGSGVVMPQKPSKRYEEEKKKQQQAQSV